MEDNLSVRHLCLMSVVCLPSDWYVVVFERRISGSQSIQ